MLPEITFSQAIVQVLVQLAPSFLVVCGAFVVFSWLRLLLDVMSGRNI